MQYAVRHADPSTTMLYDMAKANLIATPLTTVRPTSPA
jgi:hypothetical protein